MSELEGPPLQHEVRYERELFDLPSDWRRVRVPTGKARASCTCGGMDTGYVEADDAYRAAQAHVRRELPGVDWGPMIRRRSLPNSLRYLAGKLDGGQLSDAELAGVALTLNSLADEIDQKTRPDEAPATTRVTLDNSAAKFKPAEPLQPYYPDAEAQR